MMIFVYNKNRFSSINYPHFNAEPFLNRPVINELFSLSMSLPLIFMYKIIPLNTTYMLIITFIKNKTPISPLLYVNTSLPNENFIFFLNFLKNVLLFYFNLI